MTKPVQPPPCDLSVSAAVSHLAPRGEASMASTATLDALKASTLLAAAAAKSARQSLAGQLPAAAGETTTGDIGSFGT